MPYESGAIRFSKKLLRETISMRLAELEETFQFDPSNGSAQVDGRNQEAILAYGEYNGLQRLMDILSL